MKKRTYLGFKISPRTGYTGEETTKVYMDGARFYDAPTGGNLIFDANEVGFSKVGGQDEIRAYDPVKQRTAIFSAPTEYVPSDTIPRR